MPRLTIARKAYADLRHIETYSKHRWGERKAESYISDLEDRMTALTTTPFVWKIDPNLHRLYVGSHVVIYKIYRERVHVLRVLHKSMDIMKHLR